MVGRPYSSPVPSLSSELAASISSGNAAKLRGQLCQKWGITNKSHVSHGSNFSSNQTVASLLNDITAPLRGSLRTEVRDLIISDYGYDIDTQMMS